MSLPLVITEDDEKSRNQSNSAFSTPLESQSPCAKPLLLNSNTQDQSYLKRSNRSTVVNYDNSVSKSKKSRTLCLEWTAVEWVILIFTIVAASALFFLLLITIRTLVIKGILPPDPTTTAALNTSQKNNTQPIFWRTQEDESLVSKMNSPYTDKRTIVDIRSPVDFYIITENTHTVKITSLVAKSTPSGISQVGRDAVKTLELLGPITQRWLHYILSSFTSLTSIIINVDKVCSFLRPEIRFKTDSVKLPKLEKITAENSYKCPLMLWGFNIETPELKTISISKANLTKDFYGTFYNVLNKTSNTLQGIEISESTICSECDITQLQFDNLQYLRITKTVNDKDYHSLENEGSLEVSDEEMLAESLVR